MISVLLVAAAAFNLTCTGRQWQGTDEDAVGWMTNQGGKPFTDTYKINLDSGRWCFGACETTNPIAKFDDANILLSADENPEFKGETLITVSRETGQLLHKVMLSKYAFVRRGSCEAGPFTGFPRKF